MAPVDAQNSAIPGAIPPKWKNTCLRYGRIAMQNLTPIGKATAEKSVTVHIYTNSNSKLSIPP